MSERPESRDRINQSNKGGPRRLLVRPVERAINLLVERDREVGRELAAGREAQHAEPSRCDP